MVEDNRIEIDPPEGPRGEGPRGWGPGGPTREPPVILLREGSGKYWAFGCLIGFLALIAVFVMGVSSIGERLFGGGPDPETIATASLQGMREQNTLVPFSARFVAVVTSTQRRFGLSARKTLIMPGDVRYEVNLSAIGDDDVVWDAGSNTLQVTLPPLRIAGPEIDIDAIREYGDGGILMTLTDAETTLDDANRAAAQRSLMAQAQAGPAMRLARDAARRAIERNFELPLRAAGIDATVQASFRGESDSTRMERSRDVLSEMRREGQ
jgi:hypothetical protein